MSNEDRQTRALEGIKSYMGDLVRVFTAVNQNLVELGKLLKENEADAIKKLNEKVAPEGYEFKKEVWTPLRQRPTGEGFFEREGE